MAGKTLFVLLIIALLVAAVFQNTGNVDFILVWIKLKISKSALIISAIAIGFILGIGFARSKKANRIDENIKNGNAKISNEDDDYLN